NPGERAVGATERGRHVVVAIDACGKLLGKLRQCEAIVALAETKHGAGDVAGRVWHEPHLSVAAGKSAALQIGPFALCPPCQEALQIARRDGMKRNGVARNLAEARMHRMYPSISRHMDRPTRNAAQRYAAALQGRQIRRACSRVAQRLRIRQHSRIHSPEILWLLAI